MFVFFHRMADYMREILSDFLYTVPPDEGAEAMPSPNRLRNKILVKAKRLPPGKSQDEEMEEEDDDEDERPQQPQEEADGKEEELKKALIVK